MNSSCPFPSQPTGSKISYILSTKLTINTMNSSKQGHIMDWLPKHHHNMDSPKQGRKGWGCCCDTRQAVIIVNLVNLVLLVISAIIAVVVSLLLL
jgi:hypothetical protein